MMRFTALKHIRRPHPRLKHSRACCGGDPVSFAVSLSEETPLDPRLRGDDDDSGVPQ